MSLLHDSINNKKFDVRMLEKNLVRGVVSDKDVKAQVEQLPDDSENAAYISLDEIAEQKK
jgi:hypothetical protein